MRLSMLRLAGLLTRTLGVVVLLHGCVAPDGTGASPAGNADSGPSTLPIAVEFISVLVQLDGYSPFDTTVQANAPSSAFGARLLEALELAGYGLQTVSADQGRNYLGYRTSATETESGERIEFLMQLGPLSISRQMRIDDGHYVPTSPITLRAAPPGPIALNGSVYVARPGRPLLYPSGVRFVAEDGTSLGAAIYRYAWFPTGAAKGDDAASALEPARFLRQATGRLYDRGRDTRALGLLPASDFKALKSLTIRFPGLSDDLLGQDNRNALEALTGFFDREQDRLTILSCTPDRRRSESSIARSARIKSELLTLDVPGAQVLETGCPDGTKRSVARAGILVTLERILPGADDDTTGAVSTPQAPAPSNAQPGATEQE